jgi:acyl carrier protein
LVDKDIAQMSIVVSMELTPTEKIVAKIWEKDLSAPGIGPDSDFFELGGESLQMLNMLFHVKGALGVELSPGALFENSSLRAFSMVVDLAAEKERGGGLSAAQETVVEGSL